MATFIWILTVLIPLKILKASTALFGHAAWGREYIGRFRRFVLMRCHAL